MAMIRYVSMLIGPLLLGAWNDSAAVDSITARELQEQVEFLASDAMEGRQAGKPGAEKAAKYIADHFKSIGLSPISTQDGYLQKFTFKKVQTANVIGILEGSDEKLKKEVIIIGAHYDHIGVDKRGDAFNGADDDASGVSVMMEVAEAFATTKEKPGRTLMFVAFGAEELGLGGSQHYVKNPLRPIASTVLMVNLEMMGRGDAGQVSAMILKKIPAPIREAAEEAAGAVKLQLVDGKDTHLKQGDQYPFHAAGVPILCLYGGENHPDYHKATDTADKIQPEWMESVARLVYRTAHRCATRKESLK